MDWKGIDRDKLDWQRMGWQNTDWQKVDWQNIDWNQANPQGNSWQEQDWQKLAGEDPDWKKMDRYRIARQEQDWQKKARGELARREREWNTLMDSYDKRIAVKSQLVFFLCFFAFTILMCFIGFQTVTQALLDQYRNSGIRIADLAAQEIDPDQLDPWMKDWNINEEYWFVWNELDRICDKTSSTFVYVIRPDDSYEHITYYFSTVNHDSDYYPYEPGTVQDIIYEENREAYKKIMESRAAVTSIVMDSMMFKEDQHHITTMYGLKGRDGQVKGILCVYTPMTSLVSERTGLVKNILFFTAIISALTIAFNAFWQSRALLRPLEKITGEAVRFANESVIGDHKLTETIKSKDEIGLLAASIDQMEDQVVTYVRDLTAATSERERITTELKLAEGIQYSMLTTEFPAFPDRREFDIYASMDPAKEVGGDFYGFFLIDEDHLCMEIADVSGKGIPAALFMMASKIILENTAKGGMSPAEILKETNNIISENNFEKMFVTVWLGILEISTGKLTASNAGHEYPAVKKPDGTFELLKDKHGIVLGVMEDMVYTDYELELEPGSCIFTYTDGVVEAMDAENRMFGEDNMLEALNEDPNASPEQLLINVRAAVDGFVKDTEQFDDLTMLCLQYRGMTDLTKEKTS